jgi:putative ABC transport system permease protein
METLWLDIKYGVRSLRKTPGFTLVVVLTLALGIGANGAIFSVFNGLILRPLPYPEPDRLLRIFWQFDGGENGSLTATQYLFWKQRSRMLDIAGYDTSASGVNLVGSGELQRVNSVKMSENFFDVLGVKPFIGRAFTKEELRPNASDVVIISNAMWRNSFGGRPDILNLTLNLDGRPCEVVGVLPESFRFETRFDIVTPLRIVANENERGHNTAALARLKPGVSQAQAQAEAESLLAQLRAEFPKHLAVSERGARLESYHKFIVNELAGDIARPLPFVFAAAGFVLLIVCTNVANLMLARMNARQGEIAVRFALGVSRNRLVRQILTECLLIAIIGGGIGLLGSYLCVPTLLAFSPNELPHLREMGVDWRIATFAMAMTMATTLLFGISPALWAARLSANASLRNESNRTLLGTSSGFRQNALIVLEISFVTIVLVASGLVVKSFIVLNQVETGFDTSRVAAVQVALTSERYQPKSGATRTVCDFERQTLERIRAIPGVIDAATVSSLPLERGLNNYAQLPGVTQGLSVEMRAVSPQYFSTLGIATMRGRTFSDVDGERGAMVAVVNEACIKSLWKERDPLGEEIIFSGVKLQVIGVVRDIKEIRLDQPSAPTVYVPMSQVPDDLTVSINRWFLRSFLIKTSSPSLILPLAAAAIRQSDPQLPVARILQLSAVVADSAGPRRFSTLLMIGFAILSLILGTIGIYGVMSHRTNLRIHEIGIRMTLGAQVMDVMMMILGQGMKLVIGGVALGLAGAFALTRLMTSLLFGVTPTDPLTFVAIPVSLIVVTLGACYLPARRATKVDPMIALRRE